MNAADSHGTVPIHIAPRLDRKLVVEMMRVLLESGADPDLADDEGMTGWTFAVNYSVPQGAIIHLQAANEKKRAAAAAALAYDSDEMDAYLDAQEAGWN